jgi:hypothetical protein
VLADGSSPPPRAGRNAAPHTAQIAAFLTLSPCENHDMLRATLPHRARGIEGDNFVLQFLADKILFVPRSATEGEHYTFHAGSDSGVLDLHETRMSSGRSQRHRTLFAMKRDDLPAALGAMTPLLSELLALLRPLRLGWLKHHDIGVARGIDLISDEDIAAATRKRKGRLAIDPLLYERNIFVPAYLEEIYDFPDGNFALFRRRRKIGIGFKTTVAGGDVRLSWIKLTALMRFGRRWEPKMMCAIANFAIPPEHYGDFPRFSPSHDARRQ